MNSRTFWSRKDNFICKLLASLRADTFEPGYGAHCEKLIEDSLMVNSRVTRDWLVETFDNHIHDTHILEGLLHAISHLDYKLVYPQGRTMAIVGLCHKDVMVRDFAIKAFENWEDVTVIDILKVFKYPEHWLQDYLLHVISDLDEISKERIK